MKNIFYGFYEPTQEEIDKSWETGIFVFDANTLLNLYRYSESTRKDFILAITKLKDKLFMPYQVGHEYHSNRHSVIENLNNSYSNLEASIKDVFEKNLTNSLNHYLRHPSIQIENIKKLQRDFLKKVITELKRQQNNHPDFKTNDEILIQLSELYESKVGVQFSKEELKRIFAEGKERYDQQIPPGYKDLESKKKKGEQHIYGDLIIWKELISLAKKENKQIVFITDDRKEDWWTIENGKTIRPREELIKEFFDLTGFRILIYNADNFLHFAKQRKLVTKIKDTTISEVKQVRQSDENLITTIDLLKNTEAFISLTQWNNPAPSFFADLLNNNKEAFNSLTQWHNPMSSSIADFAKKFELIRAAQQSLYHPANSSIADLLKTEAFNSSIADLLKNTVGFNTSKNSYSETDNPNEKLSDSYNLESQKGNILLNDENFDEESSNK